jgi:uncharacterized membrane protein
MLLVIFVAWLLAAQTIYYAIFGELTPVSLVDFMHQVFTTSKGWTLIVVGNLVGFCFAVVAFIISVVSIPLLVDRDVGAATAAATSIRAVMQNPVPMVAWGLIVAIGLALGSIPLLLGLTVVIPILGHATWHLYRKVVVPDQNAHAHEPRPIRGRRYAADFPAALFASTGGTKPEQDER